MKPKPTMNPKITIKQAKRVLEVIDAGLCKGVGKPVPGEMCVEAAVCYGLGLPFGDEPQCVAPSVRNFKIALNDKEWSSNAARASGLRRVGIAQLGSRGAIDESDLIAKLAELTVRRIVPIALRAAAKKANKEHKEKLEAAAKRCENDGTSAASASAAYAASAAAAYAAASDAASAAYAAASDAASAASDAASAAYAAAYAASASAASAKSRDAILTLSAECCVDALRFVNAPGIKLMDKLAPL